MRLTCTIFWILLRCVGGLALACLVGMLLSPLLLVLTVLRAPASRW